MRGHTPRPNRIEKRKQRSAGTLFVFSARNNRNNKECASKKVTRQNVGLLPTELNKF
jgi:hypothetical protein